MRVQLVVASSEMPKENRILLLGPHSPHSSLFKKKNLLCTRQEQPEGNIIFILQVCCMMPEYMHAPPK